MENNIYFGDVEKNNIQDENWAKRQYLKSTTLTIAGLFLSHKQQKYSASYKK